MTQRFNTTDQAVFKTLAYADIFDFPLTASEVVRYCIGKRIPSKPLHNALSRLTDTHVGDAMFFTLENRSHIVETRRKRGVESRTKWMIVSRVARWLAYIPSIRLVGVTGALSMGNAGRDDDIDLFIITSRKTMWVTRMLTVLFVEILGNRRRPEQKEVANSICLNMFEDEDGLAVSHSERDLYTAHETLQMVPVFEKDNLYRRFLEANRWVRLYLPNWWKEKLVNTRMKKEQTEEIVLSPGIFLPVILFCFRVCEPLAKRIQVAYMQKRRTSEVVGDSVVRFHPRDTRGYVHEELSKRLEVANIPLDNVFTLSIK